jgi:hypothetical protein
MYYVESHYFCITAICDCRFVFLYFWLLFFIFTHVNLPLQVISFDLPNAFVRFKVKENADGIPGQIYWFCDISDNLFE